MNFPFPKPPNVDPPPPLGYWAVLDVVSQWGDPETLLWFQTDVPVHLWLQHSLQPPQPLPRTRKLRGIWKRVGTFWTMPSGTWYEQREVGDTYVHSFSFTGWTEGLSVWYYVDGKQQGGETVSSSILLNSVRPLGSFNPTETPLVYVSLGTPLTRQVGATFTPTASIFVAP